MCDQFSFVCDDCHRSTVGRCGLHSTFSLSHVNAAAGNYQTFRWTINTNATAMGALPGDTRIWLTNNAGAAPVGQTYTMVIRS